MFCLLSFELPKYYNKAVSLLSVLICLLCKSLIVCPFHSVIFWHGVHAFPLRCCCYMPYDTVCHLMMTAQLLCWYSQLFLLAVLFCVHFSIWIFLCSSPDCMLVSQATFQSKHYSFSVLQIFLSSTFPVPHLLSRKPLCGNVKPCLQCFTLNPTCPLCTLQPLQPPSAPTVIADGRILNPTTSFPCLYLPSSFLFQWYAMLQSPWLQILIILTDSIQIYDAVFYNTNVEE